MRCRDVVGKLAREVVILLFAGTETTAQTMCLAMQCLASHPCWLDALGEEQQRLIAEHGEEIDRKVRATPVATPVSHTPLRSYAMAFMHLHACALQVISRRAVAQEALRLKPPGIMLCSGYHGGGPGGAGGYSARAVPREGAPQMPACLQRG